MRHGSFRVLALAVFFFALAAPVQAQPATQPAAVERSDLLDLANGAVVLSKSSEYGGAQWSALALLDGTGGLGWCSEDKAPFPHEIVIELARPASVDAVAFDQTGAQESGYAGISAKDIEVWASNASPSDGFAKVLQVQLPKGGKQEFKLAAPAPARWLKFVIRSNWGNANYTELMELEAYGQPLPGPVTQAPITGTYNTNYGPIQFEQSGNTVKGCYYKGDGTFSGTTDGRVVQCEWRQDQGKRFGTALMIVSADGGLINGFWYHDGNLAGPWNGVRAKPGEDAGCRLNMKESAIAAGIAQTGRSITYGILFDTASDKIKPESEPTLTEVLALLNAQPALSLGIEGHTDAQGADAYNQDLSQRRAQSVVNWLAAKGVAAARLTASGFGKTKPVSDNATPQGRALNRRVELVKK
ncbi:MAG TPA: OmpA family protein [bacterium]|nr:OmpA family protein [bacterium]